MRFNKFWELSNPSKFEKFAKFLTPIFGALALLLSIIGLTWGAFYTPDDLSLIHI
mgnify:CR=1 FL=1